MLRQPLNHLPLLLRTQTRNRNLQHTAHTRLVHRDERLIVLEGKEPHDKLAIHPIRDAAMAGNEIAKILDVESPLEPAAEEAAEGCDQAGEAFV